jgi:serine/threonine protein kinase
MGASCSSNQVGAVMVGSGNNHQVQMGKDGRVSLTARARERRPSIQYSDLLFFGVHVKYSELYRRQQQIGKGNFGIVYKAYCKNYRVAVKELFYNADEKEATHQDFDKEVDILTRMQHPNIVRFLGAIQQSPRLCIIMEYCETSVTEFLQHVAQDSIKISYGLLVKIALGIVQALEYMHHELYPQVLHRDVKADNVLLTEDFSIKLTDFGLSRAVEGTEARFMTMCGSVLWVAPEIIRGDKYDNKVDVYSFGICLWEIFNFSKPFADHDPANVPYLVTVRFERPQYPEHVPTFISNLSQLCWHDDPGSRPAFPEIVRYLQKAPDVLDMKRTVAVGSAYPGPALTPSLLELSPVVVPGSNSSLDTAGTTEQPPGDTFKVRAGTGSVFNNDGSGSFRQGDRSGSGSQTRIAPLPSIEERPNKISGLQRIASQKGADEEDAEDGKPSEYKREDDECDNTGTTETRTSEPTERTTTAT